MRGVYPLRTSRAGGDSEREKKNALNRVFHVKKKRVFSKKRVFYGLLLVYSSVYFTETV